MAVPNKAPNCVKNPKIGIGEIFHPLEADL
jgi:hypothetical protein